MKKIIAILITITMLFSLMSFSALAVEIVYGTASWTQDFEKKHEGDAEAQWTSTTASYANGGRFSSANNGSTSYGTTQGIDGSACLSFIGAEKKSGASVAEPGTRAAAAKVFIDQSTFELNKTYVIMADVYVEPYSASTNTTQLVEIGYLKGIGSLQGPKNSINVPVETWTTIETVPFVFDSALAEYADDTANNSVPNNGLNARLDATLYWNTSTDKDRVYVDNFRVKEVTYTTYFEDKVDENGGTIDFDDVDAATYDFKDNADYETNCSTLPKITSDKDYDGNGNSVYVVPYSKTASRLVLSNIFDVDTHLGKSYNISLQIYPVGANSTTIQIGSKATEVDVNTQWGSDKKSYTIGTEGSGAKIITDRWNEVSFVYTGGYYSNDTTRDFLDGLAFTYNVSGATNDNMVPFYIDNIVITPIDYFTNTDGEEVTTTADAGYYAESKDAEDKEGVISFNSYVSNEGSVIERYTSYGIYFYRQDDPAKEATITVTNDATNKAALKSAGGYINALVEGIDEANFNTPVVAMPFVVMRGETFYGKPCTMTVNEALKWVGPKTVTE